MTVRQNISQLFDDLDNGNADLLAAGLVYNSERVKNYQPGPTYYSVSQQLVYKVPALHKYKGMSLYLIIVTGLLLCVSPFLAFS